MPKVFLFMMISLDGYFEGKDHDLSWHNVDAEFNDFAAEQLHDVGGLIFGRRTYELMADYWPAQKDEPDQVATIMNQTRKLVVSRSLSSADWHNTKVVRDDIPEALNGLRQLTGKDLAVLGSSNLCLTLLKLHLLDEVRVMVNPVVIGSGTTLFHGIEEKLELRLTKNRQFESGNILLTYAPKA
jgi:dihydrofolate reductase